MFVCYIRFGLIIVFGDLIRRRLVASFWFWCFVRAFNLFDCSVFDFIVFEVYCLFLMFCFVLALVLACFNFVYFISCWVFALELVIMIDFTSFM